MVRRELQGGQPVLPDVGGYGEGAGGGECGAGQDVVQHLLLLTTLADLPGGEGDASILLLAAASVVVDFVAYIAAGIAFVVHNAVVTATAVTSVAAAVVIDFYLVVAAVAADVIAVVVVVDIDFYFVVRLLNMFLVLLQ